MNRKEACKAISFILIFLLLLTGVSYIVRTNGDVKDRFTGFYAEKKDSIDVLMCGDSVENGKPDPEIFAKACENLGLTPSECMGLEDSFNGIISSSDAGLVTVMVPDLIPPTEKIKNRCYKVCNDLTEVIEILKKEDEK